MGITTKEKVIRKSIKIVEAKLKKIKDLNDARPVDEIFKVRKEFFDLINNRKNHTDLYVLKKLEEFKKRDTSARKLLDKQHKQFIGNITKQVKLENELLNLTNELFYITRLK
jgi:dihydropteroate synthase